MIPTTQLRVLRTTLSSRAITLPIRASAQFVVAPQRHIQPCPRLRTRAFATSPWLGAAKGQTASAVAPSYGAPRGTTSPAPISILSPTAANPPATTRPAPLELPTREPESSTFSHLIRTGKAYLAFYKTGLKNIYLNTRLVWSLDAASGIPTDTASSNTVVIANPPVKRVPEHGSATRSRLLLKRRWSHDARRLPLFALILLICGEFTPFVVLALPRAVPYTCRIPRQVEVIQRKTEERRQRSFARLAKARGEENQQQQQHQQPPIRKVTRRNAPPISKKKNKEAIAHIARSLNLISPLWDHLPVPDALVASSLLAGRRVRAHLAFLEEDTRLLVQAGGVKALEAEEVILACVDRGIDVREAEVLQLRAQLREWLKRVQVTDAGAGGAAAAGVSRDKMMAVLCEQSVPKAGRT